MRQAFVAGVAVAALALGAAGAHGHVSVLPTQVVQGEAQQFTIRVPTERELPTTAVRVTFPPEVTVYSFMPPPPGWTMRPRQGPDGRFSAVEYVGRIGPNRYMDFHILGTPFEGGTAVWEAEQVYADGQVKPWTAPPADDGEPVVETGPTDPGPAAAIEIVAPGEAAAGTAPSATVAEGDGGGAGTWLGLIAIGISAVAALLVGWLWSTRPARLPDGD